jgi:hypothetical protein
MARFLEGQIKSLSKAVAMEEIPASQRRSATASNRRKARGSRAKGKAKAQRKKRSGAKRP